VEARPDEGVGFALAPTEDAGWMRDALRAAGGNEAPVEEAQALIWAGASAEELAVVLERAPRVRWIQLPSAGIEQYLHLIENDGRTWTAAKSVYANHVAEHVVGLAIAGFRRLYEGVRTKSWRKLPGKTLFDTRVTIVGGGGIARALLCQLGPFRVHASVVRRHLGDVPGAERTLTPDRLMQALSDADLVVLAAPLTRETEHMMAAPQLRIMKPDAWLVNVARGKLIVTDDLVTALRERWIGGAGLDVTDPEPLPDGHPLWQLDNCIVTSHSSNPPNLERAQLATRIIENVRRFRAGQPLVGVVDPALGY
jgi:phosphoglycerate dehydrogenase-like enzyme